MGEGWTYEFQAWRRRYGEEAGKDVKIIIQCEVVAKDLGRWQVWLIGALLRGDGRALWQGELRVVQRWRWWF